MVPTKRARGTSVAKFSRLFLLSCALVGGAALTTGEPARAGLLNDMWNSNASPDKPDDSPQPQRGLLNRMFSPDPAPDKAAPAPGGAPAQSPAQVQQAPAADDDGEKPQPGLFNRLFGSNNSSADNAGGAVEQPSAEAKPGMFDKALGTIGLGGPSPASKIDYSERPKLAVPQDPAVLPPPREGAQRRPIRPATEDESLTKPPAEYLEKARGADGKATGLRDSDTPKEKKFFGLF